MAQMVHTTPSIYARHADRRDGETQPLRVLVEGRENTSAAEGSGSELAASPEKVTDVQPR
jgi:hypothetical protein